MNIIDFVGFIIAFVALFLMYIRRRAEIRKMKHVLHRDEEDEFIPPQSPKRVYAKPPAAPKPAAARKPEPAVDKRRTTTTVKPVDAYAVVKDDKMSRGSVLVNKLKSQRDMLIYKEIFDKPLSMRDDVDPNKGQTRGR